MGSDVSWTTGSTAANSMNICEKADSLLFDTFASAKYDLIANDSPMKNAGSGAIDGSRNSRKGDSRETTALIIGPSRI